MKKKLLHLLFLLIIPEMVCSQNLVIKNNILYDASATPNIALETGLGEKTTLDLNYGFNPFTFDNYKKWKHWVAQPEFRFWTCERFNGTFWGIHALGGQFNVGNVELPFKILPDLKDHRYEGYFYGGGISVGHQWVLGKQWNLETSIGGGYARIHYDKYICPKCGPKLKTGNQNYWGVTKATISMIYVIH